MKTSVAIIGGGPSGMFLSQLLDLSGIDNIVLERRSRDHVLGRIRAGVLEQGTVNMMHKAGIGQRVTAQGLVHNGIGIAFENAVHDIDVRQLTGGQVVTVYGQTEITRDLYAARDAMNGSIVDRAENVRLFDVDTHRPSVCYKTDGREYRIECDFIAGCDGFHGVCRKSIPQGAMTEYHATFPFGWLGILSETPPVTEEVVYASHPPGFALCSMRHASLSRYYIQVDAGDSVENWTDAAFWEEFQRRLPDHIAAKLITGPSIEKSIAPLRAFVADNLRYGRLFLAGDAGHIVPPTGAKGLNLAVADIHYLSSALIDYYRSGNESGLDQYSATALDRIWKTVRFSLMCTRMLHKYPEHTPFDIRIQQAEVRYMLSSGAAMRSFAENYVGLPY